MRLQTPFFRCAMLIVAICVSPSVDAVDLPEVTPKRSSPEPIQLRLKRFEIPFSVDAVGQRPTEVQLFVSRDAGKQWNKSATELPTGKTFLFDASTDGEYWFATRTIDGSGHAHPTGPIEPQLFVRIDTTDPRVDLHAELTTDGTVSIDLRCTDQWPNRETLRVEYISDIVSQWSEVDGVGSSLKTSEADRLEGTIRFKPTGDWHLLSIRAIVKDLAGNQTIATHQLQRPRLAVTPGQFASSPIPRAVGQEPVAPVTPAQLNPYAVKAMQMLNPPPANYYGAGAPTPTTGAGQPPTFSTIATEQLRTPSPDSASSGPSLNQVQIAAPGLSTPGLAAPTAGQEKPTRRAATPAEAMRPLTTEQIVRPEPQKPANASAPQSAARPALGATDSLPNSLPQAVLPRLDQADTSAPIRHSRSRKFSLDYEVESAGRAGVEEVELWGSTDRGQTWKRWGADPDRQTPFDIETSNDGVYGFCIVVVAKNGLATARPIAQSPPDMFVVVDTLKPVVRISGATYGEADQTGSLLIRYVCEDENLSTRPISLAFSNSSLGPWTTIAAGLENQGGYAWPADPQLPRQIYLRIDATDLAGNNASFILDSAIDVQGLAPRARIRGFNPITGTAPAADSTPQTAASPSARFK